MRAVAAALPPSLQLLIRLRLLRLLRLVALDAGVDDSGSTDNADAMATNAGYAVDVAGVADVDAAVDAAVVAVVIVVKVSAAACVDVAARAADHVAAVVVCAVHAAAIVVDVAVAVAVAVCCGVLAVFLDAVVKPHTYATYVHAPFRVASCRVCVHRCQL